MTIDDTSCYARIMLAKDIGSSLRSLRESLEWSQEHLARKMGTTKQAVSLIEKGEVSTSLQKLSAFAEAMGGRLHVYLRTENKEDEPSWLTPAIQSLVSVAASLKPDDLQRLLRIAVAISKITEDEGKDIAMRTLEREAARQ